jgi:hypothetical protein
MRAVFALTGVLVAAALLFGQSASQPKGESSPEGRPGQLEKKPEQAGKESPSGRWQMQIVQQETTMNVANQRPVRYVSGHFVYLLDTQTGTLLRFHSSGTDATQLYPKK